MNVIKIDVPAGCRYVSEIEGFKIYDFPHILNKQIPGCGFTEYCIDPLKNSENVVLCSPRKILLQNKYDQHKDEVFLVVNDYESDPSTDKDLTKQEKSKYDPYKVVDPEKVKKEKKDKEDFFKRLTKEITGYITDCRFNNKPVKILVTYDSFRIVKDIIQHNFSDLDYRVVIDEFQSIFTDSKFKSDTELQFVKSVQGIQKVCYVSATPMMMKYLEMLEEFKNLPYYELDWEALEPGRVSRPTLYVKNLVSVYTEVKPIIKSYLEGKFEYRYVKQEDGEVEKIESKEAVFYVNSVNNITSIIKRAGLTPEQVNILVANTPDNTKKIHKRIGKGFNIGTVPLRDEPRKMFTFCTRTVYLGADFYSNNARSFVVSDANIDTLAVDISLDLPQILGRQRLIENPWRNEATLFFKPIKGANKKPEEVFNKKIEEKERKSLSLLSSYDQVAAENKGDLSEAYETIATLEHYKKNYVAVNKVFIAGGVKLVPVFNNLVKVSELRAYEMQQTDYANRFTVFSMIKKIGTADIDNEVVEEFLNRYEGIKSKKDKLKFLCEQAGLPEFDIIVDNVSTKRFKEYVTVLGVDECRSVGYKIEELNKKLSIRSFDKNLLKEKIYETFKVGNSYTRCGIKEILAGIYKEIGYKATAKASDLDNYFEYKKGLVTVNNKRVSSFKLINKK